MALCYRDRTFCGSDCVNSSCSMFVSKQLQKDAAAFGLPLAITDFSDRCPDYKVRPTTISRSTVIYVGSDGVGVFSLNHTTTKETVRS